MTSAGTQGTTMADGSTGLPGTDTTMGTTGADSGSSGSSDSGSDSDSGSTSSGSSSGGSSSSGEMPASCDDVVCDIHSVCQEMGGVATCVCDQGYVLDPATQTCEVDTSCIKLRLLEDRCRSLVNGPPAVTAFFSVDYCAGTAVLPADLQAQGLTLQVFENMVDVANNVEAHAQFVPVDVESYVTLALDMSDSVTGTPAAPNPELPQLITALRTMVSQLTPAAGEPDVYVSVYVFGRLVEEYVPFTHDLAVVDAALAAIEADPFGFSATLDGSGTRLYEAAAIGINRTQRIRDLRDAVSEGGMISTGTVVVVTDGLESTNDTLEAQLIADTTNQVISVGIGPEVAANDADLTAIGRDGSFLGPTPADWAPMFDQVATRVDQYSERTYMLGYCTTAIENTVDLEVTLDGAVTVEQSVECSFDASVFSVNPANACDGTFFQTECDTRSCGGLTACGACGDDQCCVADQCMGPTTATAAGIGCGNDSQLCDAAGQVCVAGACVDPPLVGDACPDGVCDPGVGWCTFDAGLGFDTCMGVMPVDPFGAVCSGAEQCESLHCGPVDPDGGKQPTCLPPAVVYDRCDPTTLLSVCEEGSWCAELQQGVATCEPELRIFEPCTGSAECRSGLCDMVAGICVPTGACFWAWDEKAPA